MDQLLAKLVNLNYELFGVFLPGFIAWVFLVLNWVALGPMVPALTNGALPQLTSTDLLNAVGRLSLVTGVGIGIPVLIASYFLGHILLWFSRRGSQEKYTTKARLVSKA